MATNEEPNGADPFLEPAIRYYLFAGFAGLLVAWLVLMEKFGVFALVTALLGGLGMAGYLVPPKLGALARGLRRPLHLMPILVLLTVLIFEILFPSWGGRDIEIGDAVVALALVVYLVAQYRLFSLGSAAVPADTRPRPDRFTGDEPEPRPARLAAPIEVLWAGLTVLGSLIAALIAWRIVVAYTDDPEMVGAAWRLIRLVGLVGLGAIVLIGLFRVLRDYRMSEGEARMVVQDVLWIETRGEQRRNATWTAWRRRQLERKREGLR